MPNVQKVLLMLFNETEILVEQHILKCHEALVFDLESVEIPAKQTFGWIFRVDE